MREKWFDEHCVPVEVPDGQKGSALRCKTCNKPAKMVRAYAPVHDPRFGDACVASWKVLRPAIPFCPRCEVRPEESGCFHDLEVPVFRKWSKAKRRTLFF
jgi:hypothetical protein